MERHNRQFGHLVADYRQLALESNAVVGRPFAVAIGMHHERAKPAAPLSSFQICSDEFAPRSEIAVAAHLEAVDVVASFPTFVHTKNQAHSSRLCNPVANEQ